MGAVRSFLLSMAVLTTLVSAGAARAGGLDVSPFAKLPQGWGELRFGMSEEEAKRAIQAMRGPRAGTWEKTPLTSFVLPELAAGRLSKINLDAGRVHHWTINDLREGAATVRAWFHDGRLFAVQVLGTLDPDAFIRKTAQLYGAQPRRGQVQLQDETSFRRPPPQALGVAFWRGSGATALIYQPSGFGPELLIASDAGIEAMKTLHEGAR